MRGSRSFVVIARARQPLVVMLLAVLVGSGHTAHGNGIGGPQGTADPPTRFERFVLHDCSPCVREVHAVSVLVAPSLPSLRLGGLARMTGQVTRPGEIGVDVVRAYQLGRPSRQRLALRVTLSVATSGAGDMYRLGAGWVDDEDIPTLADAMVEISKALPAMLVAGDESAEAEFHAGSLRVGVIRFRSETTAYVQSGDVPALVLRPVWEVPTTLYLATTQWPALASLISQGAARAQKLRGGP